MLKLSIIIPSLNQGRYIKHCISSIVSQEYPNLEIIIIDGGSTDDTSTIIKEFAPHITTFVSESDKGQSDALNKALALVSGDIIGWQNADDYYLPNTFNEVANAFTTRTDVDIIFGNRLDVNQDNQIIGETRFTYFSPFVLQHDGLCFGTQALFWRSSTIKKLGNFDLDLHLSMDLDYFLRAASIGLTFLFIHRHLGAMRRHSASKTDNNLGKPHHDAEVSAVYARYYPIYTPFLKKIYKSVALSLRLYYYIKQSDFDYVISGILRRTKTGSLLSGK